MGFLGIGNRPDTSRFKTQYDSNGNVVGQNFADISSFGESPYTSSLKKMISDYKTPTSNFQENGYKAKDMSGTALPQYDAMRSRLDQQYSKIQSQSQDSLDRQFAAMGGGLETAHRLNKRRI
jgi:hypothetical protein